MGSVYGSDGKVLVERVVLLKEIGKASRRNFAPGLLLQLFALLIGLSYYFWPASRCIFEVVADFKTRYGIVYAFVATSFFGGVVPFVYLYCAGQIQEKVRQQFIFYAIFWALKGVEADLFYSLQAHIFGTGVDLSTVVKKTLVDQFLYAAFWVAPTVSLAYLWKDKGFVWKRWWQGLDRHLLLHIIPLVVVSNWLVWLPAVIVIYFMPSALQVPLYNLVVCYFVLMVSVLNKEKKTTP